MQDWLAAACRARGYRAEWLRPGQAVPVQDVATVIFDAAGQQETDWDDLGRVAAALADVPVIAMLDFPRVEDRDRALTAGAAAVLSKPLLVADLFWEIDRLTPRSARIS